MNDISLVYFVIPFVALLMSKINLKRISFLLLLLLIFCILYLSKNGADYNNYLIHYKLLANNTPIDQIHGELLFKKYMKLFIKLGIDYGGFRIIHITLFGLLLIYSLKKITLNIFLSIYILYCGYIVYLISAYRQLMVMSFLFLGIYFFSKNKIRKALYLNLIGIFFHISGVWTFLFFVMLKFKIITKNMRNKLILILCGSFIIRIFMIKSIDVLIKLAEKIGREKQLIYYLNSGIKLVSFGMITRLIPVLFIIFLYRKVTEEKILAFINFYIISIIFYILIPVEIIAGRLFNNGRILEVIIFPILVSKLVGKQQKIILLFVILYYLTILLAQLLRQVGYYPYQNILF